MVRTMVRIVLFFLIIFSISFSSERIIKDLEKAWSYYEKGQYIKMKKLSEDILRRSIKEKFPKGIIEGYYYLGIASYSLGDLSEALKYANKAVEFSKKHNRYRWKAYSHALVGEILRSLRRYEEALKHFKIAYRLSVENRNDKMIPPALMNIGNIYYDTGEFHKAISFYKRALEKAKEVNLRKSYLGFISYNLGITFYRSKDYKNAEKYLKDAENIYREIKNRSSMYEALFYLGKTYMKTGKKEKAREIFGTIVKEYPQGFIYKRAKYFLRKLEK